MPPRDQHDPAYPVTSMAMARLHDAIAPQLAVWRATAAAQAKRRPEAIVPAPALADARLLLGAVRRVLSREPGFGGLDLREAQLDWVALETRLARAAVGLNAFRRRYRGFDVDTLTGYWRTLDGG